MLAFLKFLGYLSVMLAIVPLAGLCISGSWRGAWRYTVVWFRVVGATILVAAVVFLVIIQLFPSAS